jgi:hypothetical protein
VTGAASGSGGDSRFTGFDAAAEAGHWDPVTARVVLSRVGMPPDIRFFRPAEEAIAIADGSVLPTQGSANPALTIMAVAARAADRMAAGAGSGTR